MKYSYTAKLYFNNQVIDEKHGEDIDVLYCWMLGNAQENIGNVYGEIIHNKTGKIVGTFRKSAIE
jgi:hypothetical protein